MNISDCIFTEKDIKQLQDCRDSQKYSENRSFQENICRYSSGTGSVFIF